ncbi:hypothetical protein ACFCYH_10535 [Streptomyces sp. NPDC056400]|uniref:hypothetical protein n=1 Tax=Streptomyces sp. NPDC056400 TaxID=3345808 RepID=UPI0035D6BBEB
MSTDTAESSETAAPERKSETSEPEPQAQEAWATLRDLSAHAPASMRFDGTNSGVSAAQVIGDIVTGDKTEIHYTLGGWGADQVAGEVPPESLDRMAEGFVTEGTPFEALLARLRHEHVLVLAGHPDTGRRTAALMLLRRVTAGEVHEVDRDTRPDEIVPGEGRGHLVCDLSTSRTQPLREAQLLSLRDRLRKKNAYAVLTTDHSPYIEDTIGLAVWTPPAVEAVLRRLVTSALGEADAERLMARPAVTDFLSRRHGLRDAVHYAAVLASGDPRHIERFSLDALERQVQEWFAEGEAPRHLREKAFLIALAAFDRGPYALTAELSDSLYGHLLSTGDRKHNEPIPVFGTHIGKRIHLAQAELYPADEETEWGPVRQRYARFRDNRTSLVLLNEIWTGHPAARPALIDWLDDLAEDGRPFVRTRAAATVGVLAYNDLPSTMALIIEPWAVSRSAAQRTTAVSALALAHRVGAPNIPRIIDEWSTGDGSDPRCWVAVRAQGLIGQERPVESLAALRTQARRQHAEEAPDEQVVEELSHSVAVLLLSPAADRALAEVLRTLDDHPSVHRLGLNGFLEACSHGSDSSVPPVLDRYLRSPNAVPGIVRLLRTALAERPFNPAAEATLCDWIRSAEQDADTERALASLLPLLAASPRETARLTHLLDTIDGIDGGPRPAAAARLREEILA